MLDVEDRQITSKRFATGLEGARAPRCALPAPVAGAASAPRSIAGVYIHATAVNNLIRRDALVEFGRLPTRLIASLFAALAAVAALAARAGRRGARLSRHASRPGPRRHRRRSSRRWCCRSSSRSLPGSPRSAPRSAIASSSPTRTGGCCARASRFISRPHVIDRMMESNKLPALGGETRNVTVFFSDVAGFSSFSEKMPPGELVALMNEYLSAMTDIIEAHGGFVDKYIGDAIVAVFGAPADDPDHAANARARRAAMPRAARRAQPQSPPHSRAARCAQRIGLNSGEALVGNIGSRRRFNYTVMGDTVNLASRLEGANKFFGTTVIASEATVALTGDASPGASSTPSGSRAAPIS